MRERWPCEREYTLVYSAHDVFSLKAGDPGITRDQTLTSVLASTDLNLRPDPVHFWDLRLQGISNQGLDGIDRLDDRFAVARARSLSIFGSLRYLFRKLERIGADFDVIGQLQYRESRGDLEELFGGDETRIQVGFVYSFGRIFFNQQFDDRDSLLNLEHGYIP